MTDDDTFKPIGAAAFGLLANLRRKMDDHKSLENEQKPAQPTDDESETDAA